MEMFTIVTSTGVGTQNYGNQTCKHGYSYIFTEVVTTQFMVFMFMKLQKQ